MSQRTCLAIVLAAGEGTRMRSATPKALHKLAGRTMLDHVLMSAAAVGGAQIAVVVGPDHAAVASAAQKTAPGAQIFEQTERLGTAHAVLAAKNAIAKGADDILVMFADTPLVPTETLAKLRSAMAEGAAVAVLGFRPADPHGYGRLVMQGDDLVAIREEKDATPEERKIAVCNGGLMALAGKHALAILECIGNGNSKGEYYLTDAVAVAREMGLKAVAIETGEDDVRGINSKMQLAQAEAVLQNRLRAAALEAGVTMIAPETVFRRGDPLVLSFGRRACRQGRPRRPLCAAAAGRGTGAGRPHRQFRRGEGVAHRGRRQGQSPQLHRRFQGRPGRQYRRRNHHL
jgi:bifunctional UDP-N-acetylglucosamine pyrophosphorylase/glucosamine-1-phosphate N-acetyltransferase